MSAPGAPVMPITGAGCCAGAEGCGAGACGAGVGLGAGAGCSGDAPAGLVTSMPTISSAISHLTDLIKENRNG